jgi:hypothetical protein
MSYYIDIIDKLSPLTKLDYRFASASGITLEWDGADAKDEVLIVGSSLRFDILTTTAEDLAFIEFFTGNETRFLVQVKNSSNDAIIWQGYLLPDQYAEPYKNGAFFVSFIASCGMGRLKGKYLPNDYYSQEKSVVSILCQILKLTGLELDVFFAPAIENFTQKDWNQIYIDSTDFKEKEKKKDAYKVFEIVLKDTLCVCYQCDNRWYVEGLNQRHLKEVTYKKYTIDGVFVSEVVYSRLSKKITPLKDPLITVIPPYNQIEVSHKKVAANFPDTIVKEKNEGWTFVTGVSGGIYARDWVGHNNYYVRAEKPEYQNTLYTASYEGGGANTNHPHDETKYVSLREKIFIEKNTKISLKIDLSIPGDSEPANFNNWKNPLKYEVTFNDVVIFTNWGTVVDTEQNLIFDKNRTAKIEKDYLATFDGLLDIKFWRPFGIDNVTRIYSVVLNEVKITTNGFEEETLEIDLINDEFTIDKIVELDYSDDKSGFSKGFRLYKLKEETQYFTEIAVPILYGIVFNAKNYSVVKLPGAKLIKENSYQVYRSGQSVNVLDVIYNFNEGEQMVVETDVLYASGEFTVKKYAVDSNLASRENWFQWTDSVYKIEKNRYLKTVANIFRRMFSVAVEKLDVTALNAVKFNDIIQFKYVSDKEFFPLNVVWNLDENKTELRLGRSFYKDSGSQPGGVNVPPIVLAGEDIILSDTQTTANLSATAYDPDGFIVSQNWTKTTGGFGDVIVTPNQLVTQLQNLTEDFYTYKIEVEDNDGAKAFDTVNVIRNKNYTVSLDMVSETVDTDVQHPSITRKYKLNIVPGLLSGSVIKFLGQIYLLSDVSGTEVDAYSKYEIFKNGASIEVGEGAFPAVLTEITLNYIAGDQIFIELSTSAVIRSSGLGESAFASAELTLSTSEFINGSGVILGLPIVKTQESYVG